MVYTDVRTILRNRPKNPSFRLDVLLILLYGLVPALKDEENKRSKEGWTPKQIAVWISALYAHEEIHIQNGMGPRAKYPMEARSGKVDFELAKKEEAEATGLTIIEVFRPILQRGGKIPQEWITNSETLKSINDNYKDSRWIAGFASRVGQ